MTRIQFLSGLIGNRWEANGKGPDRWDCYHLARHIQKVLAGRDLGDLDMPENPTWQWMVETIAKHPERKKWRLVERDAMGAVTANDLSVVLMARKKNPAHVGVWLKPENGIIHADQDFGVCFETIPELHIKGWTRLQFMEPI